MLMLNHIKVNPMTITRVLNVLKEEREQQENHLQGPDEAKRSRK
jgi:hypothetical protein